MKPMLATEANKTQATSLIAHEDWWLQQKLDGDRLLVRVHEGDVAFLNRQGEPKVKSIPLAVQSFFQIPDGVWFFDGELIGNELWLFDLLVDGVITVHTPYEDRYAMLSALFTQPGWDRGGVFLLPTARDPQEKMELTRAVSEAGGEGWILKHRLHPYLPGRRSPKMLKLKRTHTADCIIGKTMMEGKENAELLLYKDGTNSLVPIGRTSLIGKPDVKTGDVVEVKFLYVGANGRLYQPTLLRLRTDKSAVECTTQQLDHFHVNKSVIIPPALAAS